MDSIEKKKIQGKREWETWIVQGKKCKSEKERDWEWEWKKIKKWERERERRTGSKKENTKNKNKNKKVIGKGNIWERKGENDR
jgi:hypothetical protein